MSDSLPFHESTSFGWICHEVTPTFPAYLTTTLCSSSSLLDLLISTHSLTSIHSMNRHRESNPHFFPHQQTPQPRGRPPPRPEVDPVRPRHPRRGRTIRPQQPPELQADQHQHPEPQGGADPAHQGQQPATSHHSPPQHHPEDRRVRFVSPEPPHPESRAQSDAFPLRPSPFEADPSQQPPGLWVPEPQKTRPLTWFAAVFCVIFWVIVIVGGLIVLIVYMIFRPRSPRFDVSGVSLNAAYLDMGYLLNADVTVLANFTNPNRKVHVDFSYLVINLYYGDTLIASRAITPFSAASMQTMFADVHMVTSQVRLPIKDSQKFAAQVQRNEIEFQIKGYFRTRSNLGSFLRYSYWLYGRCSVVVTAPPSGVLVSRSCRTKR